MRQDQQSLVLAGTPEGRNNPMEDANFEDIKIGGGAGGDGMQEKAQEMVQDAPPPQSMAMQRQTPIMGNYSN